MKAVCLFIFMDVEVEDVGRSNSHQSSQKDF